ncbi:hypothetical protein [Burkholderia pseudomallei]|uniref:hypothetical protein n=1 Tax=Burkholderia pseudomallei TaxID=28450 RepID=UPI000E696D17|nr:hypothetical protein [Burkholderia pseudomallei]RIV65968.1 hypothetical protein D2W72_22175 [Burkholderia pseudomallei]RIV78583.1 hypothetical protein D2V84_15645 [Burkholderia pseudomallei]
MFFKTFGAVADDIEYEASCLETMAMRNRRVAINPLSEHFLADLLAPLDRYEVIRHRPKWREIAIDVARVIETALDRHWEIEGPYRRRVYCWRRCEIVERWDYPAWSHRAAMNLMWKAYSIFKRGGDAAGDDEDLLTIARQYIGAHELLSDAQLLSGLAVREASQGIEHLIRLVDRVERDRGVALWLREWSKPEVQECGYKRETFGVELDRCIDQVALEGFYPELDDVTAYRIHSEKLLLLADVCATGRLSSTESGKLLAQISTSENQVNKLDSVVAGFRARQASFQSKGAKARTKLTHGDKQKIKQQYEEFRAADPDKPLKDIELTLADEWQVSVSSIHRALGKK